MTGSNLTYQGVVIATVNANAGQANTSLEFTFNRNGTRAIVDKLIREIRFFTTKNENAPGRRDIQFQITEADGTASNLAQVQIFVT